MNRRFLSASQGRTDSSTTCKASFICLGYVGLLPSRPELHWTCSMVSATIRYGVSGSSSEHR
jgi:hypothetical protein